MTKKFLARFLFIVFVYGLLSLDTSVSESDFDRDFKQEFGPMPLNVGIYGLSSNGENEVIVGMPALSKKGDVVVSLLPIRIIVSGSEETRLRLFLRIPSFLHDRALSDAFTLNAIGAPMDMISETHATDGSYDTTIYTLKRPKNGSVLIEKPLIGENSLIHIEQSGFSKDYVNIDVPINLAYSTNCELYLQSLVDSWMTYKVNIAFYEADSFQETARMVYYFVVKGKIDKFRSEHSFLSYLWLLLFDKGLGRAIVVYQKADRQIGGPGELLHYPMASTTEVGLLTYQRVSWRKLID